MRKISLTLALLLILTLALPGCESKKDFTYGSKYFDYLGKSRGEIVEALHMTEEDYTIGPEEEPSLLIDKCDPVTIDGLDYIFTMRFMAPDNYDYEKEKVDLRERNNYLMRFFTYTYEQTLSDTDDPREIIRQVYDTLVADHGRPTTRGPSHRSTSIRAYLDGVNALENPDSRGLRYLPDASYYREEWILEDVLDIPHLSFETTIHDDFPVLIALMEAEVGEDDAHLKITVQYTITLTQYVQAIYKSVPAASGN